MRRDYDQLPEEIRDQGMDFHWDKNKLWALGGVPIEDIDISEIEWQLDLHFWHLDGKKYVLKPRDVLENIDLYIEHKERILKANIDYPIDLMENQNGRLEILDGVHRLIRLMIEGNKKVKVRKIPRDLIPLIIQD